MRKRAVIWLLIALCMFPCLRCTAATDDFFCEYVPKSATGTLFYLDIVSGRSIAAAVMELQYDAGFMEYRGVETFADTSAARCNAGDGTLQIAFADDSAVDGKLCRLSFKALRTGETSVTLHLRRAVDGSLHYLSDVRDDTLTIQFGKEDIAASNAKTGSDQQQSASSTSSGSGEKSQIDTDDTADGDLQDISGIFDLRSDRSGSYFALGAGAVVLVALLMAVGFMMGKRNGKRTLPKEETCEPGALLLDEAEEDSDEGFNWSGEEFYLPDDEDFNK